MLYVGPCGIEILNDQTVWRYTADYHPPDGNCEKASVPSAPRWVRWGERLAAPLPPADWMLAQFDDSGWPRRPGPLFNRYGDGRNVGTAVLCVRGRFGVKDPRQVKNLTLSLEYRGGVVVYLGGKELARGDMPKGRIEPLTPGDDYARKAFVMPGDAALLPNFGSRKPPETLIDRYEARVRTLTVPIPATALQAGTNVLAIELHRATVPDDLPDHGRGVNWDTV